MKEISHIAEDAKEWVWAEYARTNRVIPTPLEDLIGQGCERAIDTATQQKDALILAQSRLIDAQQENIKRLENLLQEEMQTKTKNNEKS